MRIFALIFIVLCGPEAAAQSGDGVFERYDRDGNGKVTPDELKIKQAFARYDLDKDGAITPEEYAKVSRTGLTPSPATSQPGKKADVTSGPE
ncbi:MAG: EF-hand domain-containing protein, partial [Verrucomicrobiota bacterium]